MFLKGKTALITGSTSGIGAAYAAALAAEGANVIINGFGDAAAIAEQCAALEASSGARTIHNGADLTNGEQVTAMAEACAAEFGGIDILINNAGIQHVCPVDEFPVDKWRQMQAIMVDAPFLLIRSCLPYMKAKGWGRIISTASAHASVASPNKSAYIAAKHGVLGLTRGVAMEVAEKGITVNVICPGYIDTEMVQAVPEKVLEGIVATIPVGRLGKAEEIAGCVSFLAGPDSAFMTGATLTANGGQYITG